MPGILWVLLSPIAIFMIFKLVRKSNTGKAATDWTLLKLPVVGTLAAKATIAKFTRTLGTLITAGVPILDAISITSETTGNYVFEKALTKGPRLGPSR